MSARIYLFHGEDSYGITRAREKLEGEVLDAAWRDFNLTVFGADVPALRIVEAVSVMPFGAGRRLVVVKDPAFLAAKVEDPGLAALEKLLATGLPPTAVLLLLAGKIDGRFKLIKAVAAAGIVREFATAAPWQIEEQLAPWLTDLFRQHTRRIEPDAARALLVATGGDRWRLEREAEKLALYALEGQRIDLAMVRALVGGDDVEVFALTGALARRQAGDALVALHRLLQGEHVLKVLAAMATIMRQWWRIKELSERGMAPAAIARAIGARSEFKVRKDLESIQIWCAADLATALQALLEVDLAIKRGAWAPEHHPLLLERAIAGMLRPRQIV